MRIFSLATLLIVVTMSTTQAQRPFGPPDGADGPPPIPNAIVKCLDANRDHVITKSELASASSQLLTLDQNGDGELTPEEFHPHPNADRRIGRRGSSAGQGSNQFLKRLMEFDSNGDQQIAKEELPNRMHKNFGVWDQNADGIFDSNEMQAMTTAADNLGGPVAKRGQQPDSKFPIQRQGGPNRRPNASQIAQQALLFDQDGNGELNTDELTQFAARFVAPMMSNPGRRGNRRGTGGQSGRGRPPRR